MVGSIQLEDPHISHLGQDPVNNGSGPIVSSSQNMVYKNIDTLGPVWIRPISIGPK